MVCIFVCFIFLVMLLFKYQARLSMIFIPIKPKKKTSWIFTHSEWKVSYGVKRGQNCKLQTNKG